MNGPRAKVKGRCNKRKRHENVLISEAQHTHTHKRLHTLTYTFPLIFSTFVKRYNEWRRLKQKFL